jgi:translation elongation factor EF-1alpha
VKSAKYQNKQKKNNLKYSTMLDNTKEEREIER